MELLDAAAFNACPAESVDYAVMEKTSRGAVVLENPTDQPLYLIEVQSGSYLGEDDIVRLEDRYQRN